MFAYCIGLCVLICLIWIDTMELPLWNNCPKCVWCADGCGHPVAQKMPELTDFVMGHLICRFRETRRARPRIPAHLMRELKIPGRWWDRFVA